MMNELKPEANIRSQIADGGTSCHWCEDIIKRRARAEAITEFLEKAKHHSREVGRLKPFVLLEDLYQIAEDMKGGAALD